MAREIKRELIKVRVRSEWPQKLKDDCDYFKITFKELAQEANISRQRITYITQGVATFETLVHKLIELNVLTLAFDRIIAKRQRPIMNAWVWGK